MSNLVTKRLIFEVKNLRNSELSEISAGPKDKDNLYEWEAILMGPPDTPFEGGAFKLAINFPKNYPFKPPKIEFITKMYHPNIDSRGSICLDILKSQWSPALNITKVLLSLSSLLMDPNPDDPLDSNVAYVYKNDRQRYNQTVREWVKKYAQPNQSTKPDQE